MDGLIWRLVHCSVDFACFITFSFRWCICPFFLPFVILSCVYDLFLQDKIAASLGWKINGERIRAVSQSFQRFWLRYIRAYVHNNTLHFLDLNHFSVIHLSAKIILFRICTTRQHQLPRQHNLFHSHQAQSMAMLAPTKIPQHLPSPPLPLTQ